MAFSKMLGLEVMPGHRQLVHVAGERARGEQVPGDVVEPDALAGLGQAFVAPLMLFRAAQCRPSPLKRISAPQPDAPLILSDAPHGSTIEAPPSTRMVSAVMKLASSLPKKAHEPGDLPRMRHPLQRERAGELA